MTGPASNAVLGKDPVHSVKTPTREENLPADFQSAMEGGALAFMGKELPQHIQRTCVYLFHSSVRHEGRGLEGWSHHHHVSHIISNLASADSETLSSHRRMLCPPTLSTMACYTMYILVIHPHAFPGAISLKLYFLNEATASTDSGEFVFQPEH